MSIQITCSKCFTRFNVSEKFAGQKGPCPKCKAVITIPAANQEVVVHEAATGPKDATGRPILKPIFRQDAPITAIHWTIVGCSAFVMLTVAVVGRAMYPPAEFPGWGLGFGALLCGVPAALVGYILLRDPEAGGFRGLEFWVRTAACAAGFAVLWAMSPLMAFAFKEPVANPTLLSQSVALAFLILAGGGLSLLAFEFDYLMGIVHSVSFLALCVVMRLIAGLSAVPGLGSQERTAPPTPQIFGAVEQNGTIPLAESAGWLVYLEPWMAMLQS